MKKIITFLFLIHCCFVSNKAISQTTDATLRSKHYNLEKSGLALAGYDPLSYFLGNPKKGSSTYTYNHNGVTYRFANAKNMELFKASPAKYEPAYGGWCAYAMGAKGEKGEVSPETFKIVDGRIYMC